MNDANVLQEQDIQITGKLPVLFELELKELIKAKSDILMRLRTLELDLINDKCNLAEEERNILLNTDFKELGLTNEKMRTAYVNEQLKDFNIRIDVKKHSIASIKDDIEIINDLIRLHELEMEGE